MGKKQNPPLDQVLVECAMNVGRGIGATQVSQEAMAFWTKTYKRSIKAALPNGNWSKDRRKVLRVARKLGSRAASLAGRQAISLADAQAATLKLKNDPICPNKPGGGRYCI